MDLYPDKILEHAKYPRGFGRVADPDLGFEEVNPLCGDRIRVEIRLAADRKVEEARFSGEMCAIAKGSASILLESVAGKGLAALGKISDADVLASLGGPIKSNRVQCALLAITAIRGAIAARSG